MTFLCWNQESWNEDVVLGKESSDCGEIGAALTGNN